jgi:predicted nucleotidyltransferase
MYPSINAHHARFVIDSATLQPYIDGEQPLTDLEPSVAAHVATLRDWQALHAITHPPAATFADLDPRSQAIYRALVAVLPGCRVYATGSRVRGTWRSGAPDDPKTTIAMRLNKSAESDVDVIVLGADNATFLQALAPVASAFGVRIDRQPPTLQPQIPIPQHEEQGIRGAFILYS